MSGSLPVYLAHVSACATAYLPGGAGVIGRQLDRSWRIQLARTGDMDFRRQPVTPAMTTRTKMKIAHRLMLLIVAGIVGSVLGGMALYQLSTVHQNLKTINENTIPSLRTLDD